MKPEGKCLETPIGFDLNSKKHLMSVVPERILQRSFMADRCCIDSPASFGLPAPTAPPISTPKMRPLSNTLVVIVHRSERADAASASLLRWP
jgi:hypothetical protein